MEVKNYLRQNSVSFLIKYDKYEDTLRPDSNAARLISGKNAIGTVIEYARVVRALVFDLFILLFSRYYGILWNVCPARQPKPANQNIIPARLRLMSVYPLLPRLN